MNKWIFIFCCITFCSCYIEDSKSLRRSELYKDFIDMTKKAKNHPEMNNYKLAGLSFVYVSYKIGWNHFNIGHGFQNYMAHHKIKTQNYIPWRNDAPYYPNS